MTQQYTPVAWQDETTSQQGTLINAERLNQMQTAHHFADGFEEVDAVPTADPSVAYHKIVYCTADNTFYRWDGTAWTADIDDETKRLLQEEIARATEAEGELAQDITDEATARETADTAMQADITAMQGGKLDKKTAGPLQYQIYGVRGSNQIMFDTWGRGYSKVPTYGIEEDLLAKMPTYGLSDDTVVNYGWATAQIGAEAAARAEADTLLGGRINTEQARAEAAEQANAQAIANTYTKAEIDTALGAKADVATTYSKTETDALLALKADQATTYTKTETDTLLGAKANDNAVVHLAGAETIPGPKTFTAAINAQSTIPSLNLQNTFGVTSSTPSSNYWDAIYFKDKNGANEGLVSFAHYTSGNKDIFLQLNAENGVDKYFHLFANNDGTAYATVPTRGYNASYVSDVATIATLDAYSPMLRTTGNQDKSGIMRYLTGYTGSAYPVCDKMPENVGGKYLPLFKLLKQSSMIELTIKTSSEWMDAMMDVRTSLVTIRTEKHGNDRLANTDIIVMADATTYYVYMKYPQNRKLFVELSAYAPLFANGTENLTNLDFTFFSRTLVDEPQIGDVYTDKYISQAI